MIIVKLQGGLGNQMFQHSFGKKIALKTNAPLKYDVSWYSQNFNDVTRREILISLFEMPFNVMSSNNVFIRTEKSSLFEIIKKRISGNYVCNILKEGDLSWDRKIEKRGHFYVEGYWQNYKYFNEIKELLEKDFRFPEYKNEPDKEMAENIKNSNSVGIHIRRGDYSNNPRINQYHGTCSLEYYQKASQTLEKKFSNLKYFLFSDDPEWVNDNFNFLHNFKIVSDGKRSELDEMHLLSDCKHQIIANSSFSWWGAWLNKNSEKVIIAPERWFLDEEKQKQSKNITPDEWIKL